MRTTITHDVNMKIEAEDFGRVCTYVLPGSRYTESETLRQRAVYVEVVIISSAVIFSISTQSDIRSMVLQMLMRLTCIT